ncbi:hypothetical protein VTI74DRAFT_504 [Chaetomium olivicolor]
MNDPDADRPASRGYHASPIPPSPRPSVASRASRSSLRRELERQLDPLPIHPRPASVAYSSRPHTPQTTTAPLPRPIEEIPLISSPSPLQQQQQQQQQQQPPPFTPFFTLLTSTSPSTSRQTTHHPTVHYIFADDDPEILTAALAHHHRGPYWDTAAAAAAEDDNNPTTPPVPEDRAVILDMESTADGTGLQVAWASSLTPDWAITAAGVNRMEGSGGANGATTAAATTTGSTTTGNLVLNIEGVSIEAASGALMGKAPGYESELHSSGGSSAGKGKEKEQKQGQRGEEYAELILEFEKRMGTLRKVVEAGAARQRALAEGGGSRHFQEGPAVTEGFRGEAGEDGRYRRGC